MGTASVDNTPFGAFCLRPRLYRQVFQEAGGLICNAVLPGVKNYLGGRLLDGAGRSHGPDECVAGNN